MRAAAAERVQMDAVREVQRQRAVAQQVRAARDGLQSFVASSDLGNLWKKIMRFGEMPT